MRYTSGMHALITAVALAGAVYSSHVVADVKAEKPKAQVVATQKDGQLLASSLVGIHVHNADNAKIGIVTDILFAKSGSMEAVVVAVGGFLGMGTKRIAFAPSSFLYMPRDSDHPKRDRLKVFATHEMLEAFPAFIDCRDKARSTPSAPTQPFC